MNFVRNQQLRGKKLILHIQMLTFLKIRRLQSDLCLHHLLFRASTLIYSYTLIKYLFHSQT